MARARRGRGGTRMREEAAARLQLLARRQREARELPEAVINSLSVTAEEADIANEIEADESRNYLVRHNGLGNRPEPVPWQELFGIIKAKPVKNEAGMFKKAQQRRKEREVNKKNALDLLNFGRINTPAENSKSTLKQALRDRKKKLSTRTKLRRAAKKNAKPRRIVIRRVHTPLPVDVKKVRVYTKKETDFEIEF